MDAADYSDDHSILTFQQHLARTREFQPWVQLGVPYYGSASYKTGHRIQHPRALKTRGTAPAVAMAPYQV